MKGLLEPLFHACGKAAGCNTCGSELARDSGLTVEEDVGCYGLIASKLAPTGGFEEFIFMTVLFQSIL